MDIKFVEKVMAASPDWLLKINPNPSGSHECCMPDQSWVRFTFDADGKVTTEDASHTGYVQQLLDIWARVTGEQLE
jgi:hypothetical protein